MPAGRPSKYKKAFCDQLVEKMSEGWSIESFCADVGIAKDTFYNWVKEHPEFSDAKKRGEMASFQWWEEQVKNHLFIPDRGGSFNTTAWIFNMKNRFGWRDRQPDEEPKAQEIKISIDKDDSKL